MKDIWKHLNSLNVIEGWRCRWCRGCKYLGACGAYGCCNYFLATEKRRPGKFGAKDCKAKALIDGFSIKPKHVAYCEGQPPKAYLDDLKRKEEKRQERKRVPMYDKLQPPPRSPGRKATWDTEYAVRLYKDGYFLYEICEIVGVTYKRILEYSAYNRWHSKYGGKKPPTRHDLEQAKAEYAKYKAEKEKAEHGEL